MARIDKVPPGTSFRAKLAVDWALADAGKVYGVGLNSSGKVVRGAGQTGIVGVLTLTGKRVAGEVIDVFVAGSELADFKFLQDGTTATLPGTNYYADATTGVVSATNTGVKIGHTVEIDGYNRLIITPVIVPIAP